MTEDLRLSTGSAAFDSLFFGEGIRVSPDGGTSVLIQGSAGLGKTTLALHLATNAAVSGQFACIYYAFEQSLGDLVGMIDSFGWSVDSLARVPWGNFETELSQTLSLVNAHAVATLDVNGTFDMIHRHVQKLKRQRTDRAPLIVLDSVGAVEGLSEERRHISRLVGMIGDLSGTLILVREKDELDATAVSEYVTNVVLELKHRTSRVVQAGRALDLVAPSRILLEVKKTRNQRSHRGPHEFQVQSSLDLHQQGGCVVYPSLDSVLGGEKPRPMSAESDAMCFGIPVLDDALGDPPGLRRGQSLLLRGPPGNGKTTLCLQFLIEGVRTNPDDHVLFVSCKMEREALEAIDAVSSKSERSRFGQRLHFVDARSPYQSPEQVMAAIVAAVSSGPAVRRAVVFGFGALDTIPAFAYNALTFLQVLIAYFRRAGVTSLLVDWPRARYDVEVVQATALVDDSVANTLQIDSDRAVTLVRREYQYVNTRIGLAQIVNGQFQLQPQNSSTRFRTPPLG